MSHEIAQRFQEAQQFLETGEAESAEAICADLLNQHPGDANVLCLSARALVKLDQFDEASVRVEQAMSMYPEWARPHEVQGELLLAKGELPDAAASFQKALALDPKLQRTRMKLGQVFMYMGRVDEAEALKAEFMELSQDNQDIAKAAELEKQENFEDAEQIYREILTRHPDNVSAMRAWARLGIQQELYADAEVLLQQAVKVTPGFSRAWSDLCAVQQEQKKFKEVIKSAGMLIKQRPQAPEGYVWLATGYLSAGDHEGAVKYFDKALEVSPNHVGAMGGKGNACRTIGDYDGAVAAFRESIEVEPLNAEAYWSLANLKTFRFEEQEVDKMLALLDDERVPDEGMVKLNNALGLEFDNRKDYDRSFEFIDRGNKLRREQEFYDRIQNEEKTDLTIQAFSQQFLQENAGQGDPDPAPIFIIGLPRSGSTLLEQILSSHSLVDGTHELADLSAIILHDRELSGPRKYSPDGSRNRYPLTIAELDAEGFKRRGSEYIQRTRRYRGERPFFTDKNPNNFVHVGLLHLILPNAKIINARRHPLDSCYGSYKQLFAKGQPFTYDLVEIGEYYLQYQRLMDYWHEALPGKVLDVQYEDVVADLEGQVRRILEHCELEWEESCLKFHETSRSVQTASSEQVRQPIYSSSVHTWRHYEPYLGALIETLEPLLRKLPRDDRPGSLQ